MTSTFTQTSAVDIGLKIPGTGTITGRMWKDTNANGLFDQGERALAGVSLVVERLSGPNNAVPKANTVSDANGANESDLGVARFLAVAALEASECALLTVMENVSLNPVWVGIVESIENPEFTSGQ